MLAWHFSRDPMKEMNLCIIAPTERYFNRLLLNIYLSTIETLICHRKMSLIRSTSFGFAQNTVYEFQNTVLKS